MDHHDETKIVSDVYLFIFYCLVTFKGQCEITFFARLS